MPTNSSVLSGGSSKDEGLLGGITKNVGGAVDFLRPDKLVPALIGGIGGQAASTVKEAARALPSGAAVLAAAASPTGDLPDWAKESSPLSFAVNTEYYKNLARNKNGSLAESLRQNIQEASPLLSSTAEGITETGMRGVAHGMAPLLGTSAEQILKGTRLEGADYASKAGEGQLFPALVQDLLTVVPGAKAATAGLAGRGVIPAAAAGKITAGLSAAERAPLAPYTLPAGKLNAAFERAAMGETAFPRLAEGGLPNRAAQYVGDVRRGTAQRGEALHQLAQAEERFAPMMEGITEGAGQLDDAARAQRAELGTALEQEMTKEALEQAKKNIQQPVLEREAAKAGVPIEEASLPRGFRDSDIEKSFRGLKPAEVPNFAIEALDKVTGAWKTGVLPANPAWQVGNIVNNSLTAMTFGEVTPGFFWKNKDRILKAVKENAEGVGAVKGAGHGSQFAQELKGGGGPGRQAVNAMYKANQAIDDIGHAAVYLNKLDQLKAAGLADDVARRQAADFSLKKMGDFNNMSFTEKNFIKRAIPFYAWSKHAAKMTAREALENPRKQLRLAAAAEHWAPETDERKGTGFLAGQLPLGGGKFLRLPGGMEQGMLGGLVPDEGGRATPFTSPKDLLGGSNPIIQAVLAAGGINPRNLQELETAPGQSKASAVANYMIGRIPAGTALADMLERQDYGQNVVKGDVRQPLLVDRRPLAETKQDVNLPGTGDRFSIPAPILRFLTGATVDKPNLREAEKAAKRDEKQEKKAEKAFEKGKKRNPRKN